MTILHICDGWEPNNGAAVIARLIAGEQSERGDSVSCRRWATIAELRRADEVWIHCGWKPCLWWAALWAKRAVWMPEACYDPIRLAYHGWKKCLVGPIERWALRRMSRVVATCEEEMDWIRAYEPRVRQVVMERIQRFFNLDAPLKARQIDDHSRLRLLYLGRNHPLKGLDVLEESVRGMDVELRLESHADAKEKEELFAWAYALVLPTLSDNFGLVVAEALQHGLRVITTDGAPAWKDCDYGGKLIYVSGFREASFHARVRLLRDALANQKSGQNHQ